MVEIYFNAQSDNGTLTASECHMGNRVKAMDTDAVPDHALQVWSQSYMQSIHPAKDPRAPLRLQNWMTEAGFVEVESRLLTLPLSGWSTGAKPDRQTLLLPEPGA